MNQRHLIQSEKGEREETTRKSVKEVVRATCREIGDQRSEWEVWCDRAWWMAWGAAVGGALVLRAWCEWLQVGNVPN